MGRWTLRLSLGVVLLTVLLKSFHAETVNHCVASRASTCSQCIQAGKGCAYCPDEIVNGLRCDLLDNIRSRGCSRLVTVDSTMTIERNEQISVLQKQSQVAPQLVSMSLLPGEERELDMEVWEPTKGPLDLYILMDFSNSMADDLDNLKRMGENLATLVEKLSDDYTIGFGKFVDKVVEPQTDMRPSKLAQPWPNSDPPFSFRHVIKLTNDLNFFTSELQKERISGNLDAPEGGFDAILQTAVCTDKIGWREQSTKLLVFSTESAFHFEADGTNVLSGILPRNDEQCHLNPTGSYTEDTKQDYPSVPTLVRLLGKHNLIPVFAITNHSYDYYEKLAKYFPIAEVGKLEEDSSNILHILEKAFESIRSKMSLRAEDRPKAIETRILSHTRSEPLEGTFKVKPGEIGKFKVLVKALEKVGQVSVCKLDPAAKGKDKEMRVKPSTFSSALRIKAEVLCPTCDCEKTPTVNAVRCTANGDLVCGKCNCHANWLGPFCNCSAGASVATGSCLAPDMAEACSGRGDCLCGECICWNPEQYEGPYCQFDKSQCPRSGGFLCNDRGQCFMGQCACTNGWMGSACDCPLSNQTCLDSKGGVCNGRGECKCGRCECHDSGLPLSSSCEANFQAQLGVCESKRSCVQCQAWKTGEKKDKEKCDECPFKVVMVDELKEQENVIEECSFRDEDDDCTYYYTVDYPEDQKAKELEVQVLKKKDCPPAGFLWLIPLIMFLMLLLGLLLLCCWKYCGCCQACLALLPCCGRGRMVGFKEDHYMLRQSLLTSDHLDTPLVRTGPPKSTDVVRWKITDNVHRAPNHPLQQVQPNPKEIIPFPVSLRLNRLWSDNLARPEMDTEVLRNEVDDNLNEVYKQIPGSQPVQKTTFRTQRNAGKRQNHTIVDTVLSAPRSAYPDIVKLTEKNVQSGNLNELKVVPGYYTVATDREAAGAVELQEGVESVDVRVPLFTKDEDDDKKQLQVEAVDVPLGIAEIGKRFVNITIIKEAAKSVFTFLQPAYTYNRQEGVANIPISREIIEDGRTQVTYRTRDFTAKDKKDYITVEGDLLYTPGETQKTVPVRLLELGQKDGLLEDKQVKQFVMDLSNPRQGAKLGRYPRTTVTITDQPEPSVFMFKNSKQNFTTADPTYTVPVVRTRNIENPATVNWRTKKAQRFELSGPLKFLPGENEKNIVINPRSHPGPIQPESFQLELCDPSTNAVVGERKSTMVNIAEGDHRSLDIAQVQQKGMSSPGGRLLAPANVKATATGPKNIRLNWAPAYGALGYKVRYWIYGDPEKDAQVVDVKTNHAELTNLYPYCDYETRVCAYNAMGDGQYCDMVPCQTLEDAPSEPGRLAFNVISPTVTQVSWAEPAETNGNITAYEVIYTPIDDNSRPVGATKKVNIDNPKKRMLLIENLQSAQTYQYKVRAKNSIGWGPYKDATINLASQPTRPLSIPIIPDIPIVDAEAGDEYDGYLMYSSEVMKSPTNSKAPSLSGEDHNINGKWDQGFLFPGGAGSGTRNMSSSSVYSQNSPMSTLSTNYRGGAGGSMNTSTTESTTTYLSGMSGLSGQGGTFTQRQDMIGRGGLRTEEVVMRKRSEHKDYYDENVRDSIVMGDMPSGFPDFNPRLTPGVPETPTRLVFSALGPTALKVSWQEPHCERPVLGYSVLYQLLSGGEVKRVNVSSPGDNSVVVQDLLPNHSYLFKVKGQSTEGWGPEREGVITIESAVDPKSPLSPMPGSPFTLSTPSAPGPLIFTALSPEALQLSWDKPRKPNGDILGYVVTCEQLQGGGDVRSFQVSGDSAETSLTVPDLRENMPYKFKVQARTTQGFGPEREGIITIESQDGGLGGMSSTGGASQFGSYSMTKRDVFQLPTEVSTRTNVSHTTVGDPFFSGDGMMMTTQHMETSGMVTRHVTKEVVQRSVGGGGTSITKKVERFYET